MNGIWTYEDLLPVIPSDSRITLGEGRTPLIRSRRLGPSLGFNQLYFKLEQLNPTGSYKDRFAACAVSDMVRTSACLCIATSSGNTGSALAAYCAAAAIPCYVAVVEGAPASKVEQMQVYGAHILAIRDFGKDAAVSREVFNGLAALAGAAGTSVQISAYAFSPVGMGGVQTIAYEIAEQLPCAAHVFCPAGGGGLTLAVVRGFRSWENSHQDYHLPSVHCVQPVGNDTIAGALRDRANRARAVDRSTTRVSGLQVPNILDGDAVISGCRALGGTGWVVDDELVFRCQQSLATEEGLFLEPAGATALAGAAKALEEGAISPEEPVVCLMTGHGFKDVGAAKQMAEVFPARDFPRPGEAFRFIETQLNRTKIKSK